MSEGSEKKQRWNQRYLEKTADQQQPALVLKLNQHLLTGHGSALDIACGLGGNAIFLARLGYKVTAIDYSQVALDKLAAYAVEHGLSITTRLLDLEDFNEAFGSFDVVTVSYYLQRSLFSQIFSAINKQGLLFYQTFSQAPAGDGPVNPAFRLAKGELLSLSKNYTVCFYREDPRDCNTVECLNAEAMIVVQKD